MDAKILLWFQSIRTPWMNRFFLALSDSIWWIGFVFLVFLFFKKTRKLGIYVLLSLFVCTLFNSYFLKLLFMRTRPFINVIGLEHLGVLPHGSSFPSSHTTFAFSMAWMFLWMKKKKLAVLGFGYAILVAISRMYIGVHYPTDVLAGIFISCFISFVLYQILEKKKIS